MKKLWMALAVLVGCGALGWAALGWPPWGSTAFGGSQQASPRIWPGNASTVREPYYLFAPDFGVRKIVLDPGHGADNNTGNVSSRCQDEQDFTLSLAQHIAPILEATGHFEVTLSREGDQRVDYHDRVSQAEALGADAFVSLHSDVRGEDSGQGVERDGKRCPSSHSAPGFSVLWSDQGAPELNERRLNLARATARRMQQMGILPYLGADYRGLYARDDSVAGVFVDRHEPSERIFVLHKPTMASIIIETHNAWDDREAKRWDDPALRDVFGATVAAALAEALR